VVCVFNLSKSEARITLAEMQHCMPLEVSLGAVSRVGKELLLPAMSAWLAKVQT
jgi:hypothetical protein